MHLYLRGTTNYDALHLAHRFANISGKLAVVRGSTVNWLTTEPVQPGQQPFLISANETVYGEPS